MLFFSDILARLLVYTTLWASPCHPKMTRRKMLEVGQKDKDPVNKSGGKAKKKKWSKGKVWNNFNNLVLFDKATYDKLITPAVISGKTEFRFEVPLARTALQELLSEGLIKLASKQSPSHSHQKHKGWRRPSCSRRCMNRVNQLCIWEKKTLLNPKKKKKQKYWKNPKC